MGKVTKGAVMSLAAVCGLAVFGAMQRPDGSTMPEAEVTAASMNGAAMAPVPMRAMPLAKPVSMSMPAIGTRSGAILAPATEGLEVGTVLPATDLHPITRPGLYGLGTIGREGRYGISGTTLLRYDPASMRVLGIIRTGVTRLD